MSLSLWDDYHQAVRGPRQEKDFELCPSGSAVGGEPGCVVATRVIVSLRGWCNQNEYAIAMSAFNSTETSF